MSMAMGSGGGQSANINVTPLIDVLLVLLIIFHGDHASNAERSGRAGSSAASAERAQEQHPDRTIVVQLLDRGAGQDPGLKINQEDAYLGQSAGTSGRYL